MNKEQLKEILDFLNSKGFKNVEIDWDTIENYETKTLHITLTGNKTARTMKGIDELS